MEVVHTTDWHLGFLHGKHPSPVATLMREISKPCKYARDNGIQHVIVSGDVCHSYVMSPDVQRALYRLADKYADLEFWIIPGNHDYHSKNVTSLEALFETTRRYDNLHIILQPRVEELSGVPFTFLPFPYSDPILKTPSVLVSHLTPAGAKYENGKVATRGTTAIDSEAGYWLNGHLHLAQETNYYNCCGTLYPVRFGMDDVDFGFTHLEFDYSEGELNVSVENRVSTKPKLKMQRVLVRDASEFQALEHDADTLYSLHVASGVVVPQKQLRTYSNILEIVPEGGRKKKTEKGVVSVQKQIDDSALLENFFATEQVPPDVRAVARQLDSAFRSLLQGKHQMRVYASLGLQAGEG